MSTTEHEQRENARREIERQAATMRAQGLLDVADTDGDFLVHPETGRAIPPRHLDHPNWRRHERKPYEPGTPPATSVPAS